MAKMTKAFQDDKGGLHPTPEKATLSDLETLLGRVGKESGLTAALAATILDKRHDIERIFAEYDGMTLPDGTTVTQVFPIDSVRVRR